MGSRKQNKLYLALYENENRKCIIIIHSSASQVRFKLVFVAIHLIPQLYRQVDNFLNIWTLLGTSYIIHALQSLNLGNDEFATSVWRKADHTKKEPAFRIDFMICKCSIMYTTESILKLGDLSDKVNIAWVKVAINYDISFLAAQVKLKLFGRIWRFVIFAGIAWTFCRRMISVFFFHCLDFWLF